MIKVALLTSSRADFNIYIPLIEEIQASSLFNLDIIAFGTHLSEKFGLTIDQIELGGFRVKHKINTLIDDDSPEGISKGIAHCISLFSSFWSNNSYDLIICLGDRSEMFAAVVASVPFNVKVAHISGGETTEGAIDEVYRHSISLMSHLHFASTQDYKNRICEVIGSKVGVYNSGALNIDLLEKSKLLDKSSFCDKYGLDKKRGYILITFHPETRNSGSNESYIDTIIDTIKDLEDTAFVITMPNSDAGSAIIRDKWQAFANANQDVKLIESFKGLDYLSCMKHANYLLGNTSSGFVEASFFPKKVINLGERQRGRIETNNIKTVGINKNEILEVIRLFEIEELSNEVSPYGDGSAAKNIINILESYYEN